MPFSLKKMTRDICTQFRNSGWNVKDISSTQFFLEKDNRTLNMIHQWESSQVYILGDDCIFQIAILRSKYCIKKSNSSLSNFHLISVCNTEQEAINLLDVEINSAQSNVLSL